MTQEIFINKKFSIIAVGFILYVFITFIFLIPFYFFRTVKNYNYIIATLMIKDILIIGFSINHFYILKKFKDDIFNNLMLILGAVFIVLIYKYGIAKINSKIESINNSKDYFLLEKINDYLKVITFSKTSITRVLYFYIWPLLTIGMIATIASFYSIFIKSRNYLIYLITLISVILLLIFKSNLSLEIVFSLSLVIFLFQIGINVITFSRRRYSVLFGIGTIAIWALNNYLFLVLITISFCFVFTYIILKRPWPSLFTAHLIAPLIFIWAFWIRENYTIISIIVFITIIIIYWSFFYIVRFNVIENSVIIKKLNFLLPIIFLISLYLYSFIKLFTKENLSIDFLWSLQLFIYTNNNDLKFVINIFYYIFFITTIFYSIFVLIKRKNIVGIKLIYVIAFWSFILTFNPLVSQFWISIGFSQKYMSNMPIITIYPILMMLGSLSIKKFLKSINSKNKMSNNYNHKHY